MKSMTGYGYKERSDDRFSLSVEIKGYNNRFLEIFVNLPPYLSPLEMRLRITLPGAVNAEKIELSVRAKELGGNVSVSVDEVAAAAYTRRSSGWGPPSDSMSNRVFRPFFRWTGSAF